MKKTLVVLLLLSINLAVSAQQPVVTIKTLENFLSLTPKQLVDSLKTDYILSEQNTVAKKLSYIFEAKTDKNQVLAIIFYEGKIALIQHQGLLVNAPNFKNSILNAGYDFQREKTIDFHNYSEYAKGGGKSKHGKGIDISLDIDRREKKYYRVIYHNWQNTNNTIFMLDDLPDPQYAIRTELKIKKYLVLNGSEHDISDWYSDQRNAYEAGISPTDKHSIIVNQNGKYYKIHMTTLPGGFIAIEFFTYNFHLKA